MWELLGIVFLLCTSLFFAWRLGKKSKQLDEALQANQSLPLYRQALKRQSEELDAVYRALIDRESVSGIADVLNHLGDRVHEDSGDN